MASQFQNLMKFIEKTLPSILEPYMSAVHLGSRLAKADLENGGNIDQLRKQVNRVLLRLSQTPHRGTVDWLRAYFQFYVHEFDDAYALFQKAEASNSSIERYWMDRGRLEYNSGRLVEALASFKRGFALAEAGGTLEGHHYRWLAKTNRWLGRFDAEADILKKAVERDGGRDATTLKQAVRRVPAALLLSGQPQSALDFVQRWRAHDQESQVSMAVEEVKALGMLGRQREAEEYANRMSGNYSDGEVIRATALAQADYAFSAYDRLLDAFRDAVELQPMMMIMGENPETGESFMRVVEVGEGFYRNYQAASRAIEVGRADLATDLLIESSKLALREESTYPLSYCLQRLNEVALDNHRLAQVLKEAVARFPEEYMFHLHAGRFHLARREYRHAFDFLERAATLSPMGRLYAEPLMAEVIGGMGDDEEALRLFRDLLARDWRKQKPDVVAQGIFQPAMRWAELSGHHFQGLAWAEDWIRNYAGGVVTFPDSLAIHLSAGRIALGLGDHMLALKHFKNAAATYAAWLADDEAAEVRLADMARCNALVALSALLAGEVEQASKWLEVARNQSVGLEVVKLVEALLRSRSGDFDGAFVLLLDIPRSPLWAQVASIVAAESKAASHDDLAVDLERKAAVAVGQVPTPEEALARLDEQESRLMAARAEASTHSLFQQQVKDVFEALMVRSGILAEDHAAYAEMRVALESGKALNPERITEAVMQQLGERVRQEKVVGDVCRKRIGDGWELLPSEVQKLLSLTEDHHAYAEQHSGKDFGPALMYLARTIEDILKQRYAPDLSRRLKLVEVEVPWNKFTLGTLPFLLGPKAKISEACRKEIEGTFEGLTVDMKSYFNQKWPEDAGELSKLRNRWAHQCDVITAEEFLEILDVVVGAPGTKSVLAGSLALALAVSGTSE